MGEPSAPSNPFSIGELVTVSNITTKDYVDWWNIHNPSSPLGTLPVGYLTNFINKPCMILGITEEQFKESWYIHYDPKANAGSPGGLRVPVKWLKPLFLQ